MRGLARAVPVLLAPLACGASPRATAPREAPQPADAGGCPAYEDPSFAATISAPDLTETSGLVVSGTNPGVLWAHNDSGDTARLFAIAASGAPRAVVHLAGAGAVDWEDLAIAPGQGGDDLYAGDIGDNGAVRAFVTVYRVHEPVLPEGFVELTLPAEALELTYEDGLAHNAEALIADPQTGALVVVTKNEGPSTIFVADPPFVAGTRTVLHARGTLTFGQGALPGNVLVTGASATRDGNLLALRTYTNAFAWRRGPGQSVEGALLGTPCPLPVALEIQGEAIAFSPNGDAYYTTTEGTNPPLSISLLR